MPKLSAKIEGKGNGVRTVIVNVTDIAKALYRKPIYVTKFFGCELGTLVHVDEKNDRYIINGAHEAAKLQELLHGFIKKFVLCQNCGNPETALTVKSKAGIVTTTCKACGNRGELDLRHRLTQYIIKNPPVEDSTTSAGKPRGKKSKKANANDAKSDDEDERSPGLDDSRNSPEFSDDDDWGEDVTEEAQQERMKELSSMARSLAMSADIEKSETERANIFFKHIVQLKLEGSFSTMASDLFLESERLGLGCRAVVVVAEVLLSDSSSIVSDIEKYKSVFTKFTRIGVQAKKSQSYLLGAMVSLIEKNSQTLLSKSCHILKQLYDCDVVEEDVIISWFDKRGAKRYVSKSMVDKITEVCKPMLTWLAEAEEESEDDEEENSESEEDSPINHNGLTASPARLPSAYPATNHLDEKIDIDAI